MCPSTVLFAKRANLIQLLCIHCILCVLHRPWPSLVCVATAFIYRTLLKLKLKSTTMLYRYWCVCKLWLYEVFTFLTVRTYIRTCLCTYALCMYVCAPLYCWSVLEKLLNVLVHLVWAVLLHPVTAVRDAPTQKAHKRHTKDAQKTHNVSHTTVHTVYNIQHCTYSKVYNA